MLTGHRLILPFALILATTAAALALRLPRLEQRPMHGDEAVHAIKFGVLLEEGFYRYDRFEYHGPTLNYLTLIPAWLSSARMLTEVSEWTLRIVPVFFGTLLVLLPVLLMDGLGKSAVIVASILTAISPAMAYYSRYYIQEMLLVCFTFGVIACAYRYTQSKKLGWALSIGIFLGLMHATKETCVIAWGAMLLAFALTFALRRKEENSHSFIASLKATNPWHVVAAVAVAGVVSAMFYSSFFANAKGVLDSILTYKTYLSRAGHNEVHIHPWHYYLNILAYFRIGNNSVWSEALILILAAVGFVVATRKKVFDGIDDHLLCFIAFYTFFMTAVYSIIPYKTPWNLISFLHGMILLAGVGAVAMMKTLSNKFVRIAVITLIIAGGVHLVWQAYLANYKYYENPANPYVYAHPLNDTFKMVRRVEAIAPAHPDGRNLYIQVICPDDDYWPLPWYLRSFTHIGWWNQVDANVPAAPLIIASPKVEPALMRKLYELPPPGQRHLYVPLFDTYTELRPRIELRGYVRKDLWDRFQESVISDQ
ncbi:TIGR03663 family protein [candidate division KSB1 bacterium]|nr:TIGR03663 family protein [candidate division KSB1 bacterium]